MSYYCKSCGSWLPYKDAQCSTCHYENRFHDLISGSNGSSSSYTQRSFTGHKDTRYPNGDRYVGDYVNGQRQGKGIYYHANNAAKYEGEYYNNVRHGFGIEDIHLPEGTQHYEGEWYNDKRHGKGRMIHADGEIYEGEYKEGKRHGKGKVLYTDGEIYEGEFREGQHHGQGTYYYAKGSKYVGQWENGQMHGRGAYYYANGDFYNGGWVNDKKEGQGTYIFANGTRYDGEFGNNNINGRGICRFADGEIYDGEWLDGKSHGRGRCILPDGTVQDGYFENGDFIGNTLPKYTVTNNTDMGMDISPDMFSQFMQTGNIPATNSQDGGMGMDITPDMLARFMQGGSILQTQSASSSRPQPEREIWDKLISLSPEQRNEFLSTHPNVTVPGGVTVIPKDMFRDCMNLRNIRFNQDLREIGAWAFKGCKNLHPTLVIPSGVERIGRFAFATCTSIKKVILPNNITVEEAGLMCSVTDVEFETEPPMGVVLEKGALRYSDMVMSKDMKKKIKELNPKAFK